MLITLEILIEAYGLALDLYDGDKKKAKNWLFTENPSFLDEKPVMLILGGRSLTVMSFLKTRLGI